MRYLKISRSGSDSTQSRSLIVGSQALRAALLSVLLGLAACSPYGFSKEVASIDASVAKIADAYTAGYAGITSDRENLYRLKLIDARASPVMATSCRLPTAVDERPCLLYPQAGKQPEFSAMERNQAKSMATVAVLRDYAQGLAAVTNAKDRDAYDAAVAQLSGAVGALAKTADPALPGASILAPALVNVIGWVVGTALDQQRYESLRAATAIVSKPDTAGNVPIKVVAQTLGQGLFALSQRRQALLQEQADILVSRLGPSQPEGQYRQRLEQAESVVTMLDQLRRADARVTGNGLIKAHDRLVDAINDPARHYAALLEAVNEFADQATALHTAIVASQKATAKKGM